jgi:hypothetical protein
VPQSSRRGWVVAGVAALVLVVIGAGIGIWRYQDSGESSTPNAAANEAPNPGPRPGDQDISIDQTWAVPAGTHVTITFVNGSSHCTRDEKNPSFDTGGAPYKKVELLYTRTTADVCRVQLSTARYTVKTSTGQTRDITVAQTTLTGLYQTKCEGGNLPCRDSGGASRTTSPVIAFG